MYSCVFVLEGAGRAAWRRLGKPLLTLTTASDRLLHTIESDVHNTYTHTALLPILEPL